MKIDERPNRVSPPTTPLHEDRVNTVKARQPDDELLYEIADQFRAFGDSTRIRILSSLFISDLCVHDLSYVLNMNQSAVSHQLRILKQARLIRNRRVGKLVYYSLADAHVKEIFDQVFRHVKETH